MTERRLKRVGTLTLLFAVIGLCFVGKVTWAATPSASGPVRPHAVLYDQYDSPGATGTNSQQLEAALEAFDDQAADDFSVPAGASWTVNEVDIRGAYYNGTGPAESFNVYFYADSGGLPGTLVSQQNVTFTTFPTIEDFVLPLAAPVALAPGSYWLSVQARMDFSSGGQWSWTNRSVATGSSAAWRNQGGGYGICPGWTTRAGNCGFDATEPDQVFRLAGTSGSTPTPQPSNTATSTRTSTLTATATGTPTRTFTPTATNTPVSRIVGHITWQTIPQPDVHNVQSATLTLCIGGVGQDNTVTMDASGFFTLTLNIPDGPYNWRIKGHRHLANSGSLSIVGGISNQEMGTLRGGDSVEDNLVDSLDFNNLKNAFGGSSDLHSDFNFDGLVDALDFNILKNNFGVPGASSNCP